MAIKGFWGAGAIDTPPALGGLTSVGYPTAGDPTRGVPATQPSAAWFFMVDQMRVSLVQAAGMTPAASDTQWLDALKSIKWIGDHTIDGVKLKTGSVTTDLIKNEAVTADKLAKTIDVGASSITFQVKTQTSEERTRLTPAKGELIIDTTKYELYGGDGATPGGKLLGGGDDKATSAMVYDIADLRKSSTAYELGDVVGCAYQSDKYLECTKAGTTGASTLDTRTAMHGQVLTDGTVQWTVRTRIRKVNNAHADATGNIVVEGGVKTVNSSSPDSRGNVTVDVGVKKINGQAPDGQGNFALFTSGTEDLQAGTSPLATGKLHFVYE